MFESPLSAQNAQKDRRKASFQESIICVSFHFESNYLAEKDLDRTHWVCRWSLLDENPIFDDPEPLLVN